MDRPDDRGPTWIWPALVLAFGAIAVGIGCGVPAQQEGVSAGPSANYAVACEGDGGNCDGGAGTVVATRRQCRPLR
jgi:hypothetical protein